MILKEGTHYARPLQLLKKLHGIRVCNRRKMSCEVSFMDSCRYDVGRDQSDINKLFGFSLGMHHTYSVRVGWRYVPRVDAIEIVTYIYRKGERLKEQHVDWVSFGKRVRYAIELRKAGTVHFYAGERWSAAEMMGTQGKIFFSYPLSLYFGGNCKAPHDMTIDMNVNYD